jgi:hypothetical protein
MRKRATLASLILALSSSALTPGVVVAQEKDAVTEMARRRFQEGVKFFDQKRFEEARAAFLQAYALKHHPAVLLNLAQSEIRSNHPLEAAKHFSAFLRESPSSSGAERSEAEKGLTASRSKLGKIQVTVAAGADVFVDGEAVGQSPLAEPVDAAPGNHNIEAKLNGRAANTSVSVTVGKSTSATLTLESGSPPPVAPPPPSSSPPPPAPTPEPAAEPPPAEAPKEAVPSTAEGGSSEGREPFFAWGGHAGAAVGLGLTAVGIGVFAGFGLASMKASDNADAVEAAIRTQTAKDGISSQGVCGDPNARPAKPPVSGYGTACSVLTDDMNKRDTDRTIATVGIIAAGVSLVGTITLYFATARRGGGQATEPHIVATPTVGPHQSGLAIVGSF